MQKGLWGCSGVPGTRGRIREMFGGPRRGPGDALGSWEGTKGEDWGSGGAVGGNRGCFGDPGMQKGLWGLSGVLGTLWGPGD